MQKEQRTHCKLSACSQAELVPTLCFSGAEHLARWPTVLWVVAGLMGNVSHPFVAPELLLGWLGLARG